MRVLGEDTTIVANVKACDDCGEEILGTGWWNGKKNFTIVRLNVLTF